MCIWFLVPSVNINCSQSAGGALTVLASLFGSSHVHPFKWSIPAQEKGGNSLRWLKVVTEDVTDLNVMAKCRKDLFKTVVSHVYTYISILD